MSICLIRGVNDGDVGEGKDREEKNSSRRASVQVYNTSMIIFLLCVQYIWKCECVVNIVHHTRLFFDCRRETGEIAFNLVLRSGFVSLSLSLSLFLSFQFTIFFPSSFVLLPSPHIPFPHNPREEGGNRRRWRKKNSISGNFLLLLPPLSIFFACYSIPLNQPWPSSPHQENREEEMEGERRKVFFKKKTRKNIAFFGCHIRLLCLFSGSYFFLQHPVDTFTHTCGRGRGDWVRRRSGI